MKKILLDFNVPVTQEQVQDYLALTMEFPDYYGKNLDALYDCLTDICEDTCIGIFNAEERREISLYLNLVKQVFQDAEAENPHLCIVFSQLEENYREDKGGLI